MLLKVQENAKTLNSTLIVIIIVVETQTVLVDNWMKTLPAEHMLWMLQSLPNGKCMLISGVF